MIMMIIRMQCVDATVPGFQLLPAILKSVDLTCENKPCVHMMVNIPYTEDASPYFCFLISAMEFAVNSLLGLVNIEYILQ